MSDPTATAEVRRPRWQFSLRAMLALVVLAGCVAAVIGWWVKPHDMLHIELAAGRQVWIEGRKVAWEDVHAELERFAAEAAARGQSPLDLPVHFLIADDASYRDFVDVLNAAHAFERFRLSANGEVFACRIPRPLYMPDFDEPGGWFHPLRLKADAQGNLTQIELRARFFKSEDALRQAFVQMLSADPLEFESQVVGIVADDDLPCRHVFAVLSAITFDTLQADGTVKRRMPNVFPVNAGSEFEEALYQRPVDLDAIFSEQWSESEWSTPDH